MAHLISGYPPYVQDIIAEISRNEIAIKMSYPDRLPEKIEPLLNYFRKGNKSLKYFFEAILFNVSIKKSHLENSLKFMNKFDRQQKSKVPDLIALLWPVRDKQLIEIALSEDKSARSVVMKNTLDKIDFLRKFTKKVPVESWNSTQLKQMSKALNLSTINTMKLVEIRPRILRGLRKPLRPIYAWPIPGIVAFMVYYLAITHFPVEFSFMAYPLMIVVLILGLWVMSTRVFIAPGILYYKKTKTRLTQALNNNWQYSPAVQKMRHINIDYEQFARSKTYHDKSNRVMMEVRDKRTIDGAMKFLTSSELIDNCIALRNFVSWCLPSLLNDETIMLCDVSFKGHQRAQLWMIAAEREGTPVLTVNSIEFNDEGAKYLCLLMPEIITVLQDIAHRSGFREIYIGISDFGRNWFDEHYPQGKINTPIHKIHCDDLGYLYYFDSFKLKRFFGRKRYCYMQKRTLIVKAYALIFGMIELAKGNPNKAREFFYSVKNSHNFWRIPTK